MIYNPYDYYFNKAKQEWYKARSAFKLEEIQEKYKILDKNTKIVLDIWCSPWSWMQYTSTMLSNFKVKDFKIIWFDIKESEVNLPNVYTYVQDVTNVEKIDKILKSHQIIPCCHSEWNITNLENQDPRTLEQVGEESTVCKMDSSTSLHSVSEWQFGVHWKWQGGVDFIQSDMAPNTVGHKSVDAIRSIWLLEDTLRIYKKYLKPNWKFAIKIFMWPGFEEFVSDLKQHFGHKNIKIFKPKACRSISKETYIVKI